MVVKQKCDSINIGLLVIERTEDVALTQVSLLLISLGKQHSLYIMKYIEN